MLKSIVGSAVNDQPLGVEAHLEFGKHIAQGIKVGGAAPHCVDVKFKRHVGADGGQLLGETNLLNVVAHVAPHGARDGVGVAHHALNTLPPLDEFNGLFRPHARAAGDIVGGVAHQAEQVNHLGGRGDVVFVANALHVQAFVFARIVDGDAVAHQLRQIFVATHEYRVNAPLLGGVAREGAHHVVGLKARRGDGGDVPCLKDATDVGYGVEDVLGCLVAVLLVRLILLAAEGLAAGVKAHGHVAGRELLEEIVHDVDKAKHGAGVHTGGGDARGAYHRVVGAENHRVGVDEEQQVLLIAHGRES